MNKNFLTPSRSNGWITDTLTSFTEARVYNENGIEPYSKDDYNRRVKARRREMVHLQFSSILEPLFSMLRKDAELMRICHRELIFDIAENLDMDKMETMLCSYFSDLGYKTLAEPRRSESRKIIITLT